MKIGVVMLNFGEPEHATPEEVVPFLERIFLTNASLNPGDATEAEARARSRMLAERRAPGLIEEYLEIGGSPANAQAAGQAELLQAVLRRRGLDAHCYVGMQFTEPSIRSAVGRARADGVERLIGLPVYPTCGPSTTVAALVELQAAMRGIGWDDVEYREITGWDNNADYTRLRADGIRRTAEAAGLDLAGDPRHVLVFSAHGTPLKYIREGSRYDLYTEDTCRRVADAAGVEDYVLGYQNHTNRPVEWTQPDIDDAVRAIDADEIVVVPISFMHEQSETLAELDHELKAVAEEAGLGFHRVPVPYDDPRFIGMLADLLAPFVVGASPQDLGFGPCRCKPTEGTLCLNWCLARA